MTTAARHAIGIVSLVLIVGGCGPTKEQGPTSDAGGDVHEASADVDDAGPTEDTGIADADTGVSTELMDPTGFFRPEELRELADFEPLGPVPDDPTNRVADDPKAAHFGRFLFYDTRLSGNGEVSCATCHQPDHGFADPKKLSEGMGTTARHAPTLLNVSYNRWYFWDGRADSTWAQTHSPLEAPNEQGISRLEIAHLLFDDTELKNAYEEIFGPMPDLSDEQRFPPIGRPVPSDPDGQAHKNWQSMTEDDREAVNRVMANVGKAIGAFERQLVSKNAPFDRFIRGLREGDAEKVDALSEAQKRGLRLFVGKANCNECHTGPFFSDLEFHNIGLPQRAWLPPMDLGRYEGVTTVKEDPFNAIGPYSDAPESTAGDEIRFLARKSENRGQFKTATLRNIEQTPPYMHGGHFETLEEVVEFYAELDGQVLVGHREESLEEFELSDGETDDLVAFLKSLTGEPVDEKLKGPPETPLPR